MSGKEGEWYRVKVNGGICERDGGVSLRDKPLTLSRYHSYMKLFCVEVLYVAEITT